MAGNEEEYLLLKPYQSECQMRSSCIIPPRLGDVFMFVEPEYSDHQISKGCHNTRCGVRANLTEVLLKRYIPHRVQSVLDTPLSPVYLQQSLWKCLFRGKAGDTISHFAASLFPPEIRCDAVDPYNLLIERELYIPFEVSAAANLPGLDASMPLVECFMLRGE
jgi:hypothetical protein